MHPIAPRLAVLVALTLPAQAAWASAELSCSGTGDKPIEIAINLPRSAPARPNWVRVDAGELWSTLEDEGARPVAVLQSFDDGREFRIDLSEPGGDETLVAIRISTVEEGDETYQVGYARIAGRGVYPIICEDTE
jgi:hypothetical protein